MHYASKELIEHANEQIRKDEECYRELLEAIDISEKQWAVRTLRKIIAEQELTVSDEEFEQVLQESLEFIHKQKSQRTIIFNEINIGGQ